MVNLWKLGGRPGIPAEEYIETAVKRKFVSIGWAAVSSLSGRSLVEIRAKFKEHYGRGKSKIAVSTRARMMWKFANSIKTGDIVVLYDNRKMRRQAYIGFVGNRRNSESPYFHVTRRSREDYFSGEDNACHRVSIERWLGQPRPMKLPQGTPWSEPLAQITSKHLKEITMGKNLRSFLQAQLRRKYGRPPPPNDPPTDPDSRARDYGEHTGQEGGHGWGPESPEHRRLRKWVYAHPEFLGVKDVWRKWMHPDPRYELPTGDSPDVVFCYNDDNYLAVEIETDEPKAGAYQAIKYRALICADKQLKLNDKSVRTALVAHDLSPGLRSFCKRYGIVWKTKRFG